MSRFLHNPASRAHIEDLRDRLSIQLARAPRASDHAQDDHRLVDYLKDVVRARHRSALTPEDALDLFAHHRVPGFSFGKRLIELVNEDVYLEELIDEAA